MPPASIAPAHRIGSREHWVAVDQNKENVQSFGVYTQDHQHLIDYLRQYDGYPPTFRENVSSDGVYYLIISNLYRFRSPS